MAAVRSRYRSALVVSAAAGMVIAVWLTARVAGWNEDAVTTWIPESTVLAAVVIIGLLAVDTVLPIPATILMLGSGAILGPILGAAVNAAGLTLGALGGYVFGRMLAQRDQRISSGGLATGEPDDANQPLWMIAVTRGLPILSESVAIGAGALAYPSRPFALAAITGSVGAGFVWSIAGALARDHWALVFAAAMLATITYATAVRFSRVGGSRTRMAA